MNNKNMTPKERNLLKGAVRRVFSRSELRRSVVELTVVRGYEDTKRPRVKTWCKCPMCKEMTPKSYMQVDHIVPIIGLSETLADLSWDTVIDRTWCNNNNLQALCITCHLKKTKEEKKQRTQAKKRRNSNV